MAILSTPLLAIHVKQFMQGVSPGGADGLGSFLERWKVSKWDIANMLDTMPADTAMAVRGYFGASPKLKEWLVPTTPTLTPQDVNLQAENARLRAMLLQIRTWLDTIE